MADTFPSVLGVQIVTFRPRPVDRPFLAHLQRAEARALPQVVYAVKVLLDRQPPPMAYGLFIFVGKERMRMFGEFSRGIFLLVHDPAFLAAHAGAAISFSWDGVHLHDTGWKLPPAPTVAPQSPAATVAAAHPTIEDALEH